jgi:hypothetical protein
MSKVIVMQKAGKSYVKLGSYGSFSDSYVINGKDAVPALGDKSYAIVDGDVMSLERKRQTNRKVISYALAERYKEITQLPHEMPADAFYRDEDGDLCGVNVEFYRAVYDDPQPYLEPVEYEIIDRDCEPVAIPSYVTIEFPNNIARYPETQHKYPCRIGGETVFNLLWESVKVHVDASDGKYSMDDYKNIQTLTVSERIALPEPETRTSSYYPTSRSRKPRTRSEVVRWKSVKVFEICGPKYSNSGGRPSTSVIRGGSYADLQAKLEAYIQTFIEQMTEGKRHVCGHCRGEGIVSL